MIQCPEEIRPAREKSAGFAGKKGLFRPVDPVFSEGISAGWTGSFALALCIVMKIQFSASNMLIFAKKLCKINKNNKSFMLTAQGMGGLPALCPRKPPRREERTKAMKLSMWMILNRLEYLDPEIHIRPEAPRNLRSAHRTYATNCVHVFPGENGDVICQGGTDYLILKDIDPLEALDMVQYVFDFYNDWGTLARRLLSEGQYQKVVEQTWTVFHNPVILFDANFRLMGIAYSEGGADTAEDGDKSLFLRQVENDSLQMVNQAIREYVDRSVWNNYLSEKPSMYQTTDENGNVSVGAVCNIFDQNFLIGRLFVIEKDRRLNPGDLHFMEVVARLIRAVSQRSGNELTAHPFYRILNGEAMSPEIMDNLMALYGWKRDDAFRVFVVRFPENMERKSEVSTMLRGQLAVMYPDSVLFDYENELVGIIRAVGFRDYTAYETLETMLSGSGLTVGTSIENRGIEPLAELLRQARYACCFAQDHALRNVVVKFFHCAVNALLFTDWDLKSKLAACHPGIVRMMEDNEKKNAVLFETLVVYMQEERSVSAAAKKLFVHKNTMLYRLNQIYEYIPKSEFDSSYCRSYIQLSLRYLQGSLDYWAMDPSSEGKRKASGA